MKSVSKNTIKSYNESMSKAGEYIGDIIYGANDGIITTFAVAASAAGAVLEPRIVVILGVANLIADGFSMASSNYLARRSEQEYQENVENLNTENRKNPIKNAVATFWAFVLAGFVPLIPYVLGVNKDIFIWAVVATSITLFLVGSLRAIITKSKWYLAGLEMLLVGASAASVAYFIGYLLGHLI